MKHGIILSLFGVLLMTHCASQSVQKTWVPNSLSQKNADAFAEVASELENPCVGREFAEYDTFRSLLEAGKTCREASILSSEIVYYLSHDISKMQTLGIVAPEVRNLKHPHTFIVENRPRLGNAGAVAEIVVFSDFQCPYCAFAAETLHKVYEARPESVSVVFKHFPLQSIHPYAAPAALVAAYAHRQGKFWEMHDRLFASQKQLDANLIAEMVTSLGTTVDELFDSEKSLQYGVMVVEDMKDAQAAEIQGTPTIFVNGVEVPGGLRYDRLLVRIDAEIHAPQNVSRNTERMPPPNPYPDLNAADYAALSASERATLGMYTAGALCPCRSSNLSLHQCAVEQTCPEAGLLIQRIVDGMKAHMPEDALLDEMDAYVQKHRSAPQQE